MEPLVIGLANEPATSRFLPSAEAGAELNTEYPGGGMPGQASVPLAAGRWRVRATHTKVDEENWVGLVQILPTES
ncbi:hypothetical protein [Streptomyces sp. NPDC002324]